MKTFTKYIHVLHNTVGHSLKIWGFLMFIAILKNIYGIVSNCQNGVSCEFKRVTRIKFTKQIEDYLSQRDHLNGRILLALANYLVKYSKQFDDYSVVLTDQGEGFSPNETHEGVIGQISRVEADVGVTPLVMNEQTAEILDFAYPFRLSSLSFAMRKPEYEPKMFGILQTFPLSLWIAILTVLIVLSTVYYSVWKRKYAFSKTLLHVFAVLVRQSAVVRASSFGENLLVYSWVAGAMILFLAYDSVFLPFFTIPPVNQVEDIPQLAAAVGKGTIIA